jgi:type I restriction enzyme S subunit
MTEPSKKGWATVAFGDVVKLSKESAKDPLAAGLSRYVGLDHLEPGDLKIRRWGSVADGTTFTNVFRPGQVLFGKRRAYQRKVAVSDFSGVCSGDIYVFTPKDDRLLAELLPFICQTDGFFDHAIGTSAGSLSPRTNWKSLASYEFALPPLDEQCRLANVLKTAGSASEAQRSLLDRTNAVARAIEGRTTSDRSDVRHSPLGELVELVMDFRGRTPKKLGMKWGGGDIPALSAMNVLMGEIDLSRTTSYGSESLYRRWMTHGDLRRGDILFTTEAPLGNICVLRSDERFILSQRVVALRPDPRKMMTEYLAAVMRTNYFRQELIRRSTGTTAKGIRVAALVEIPVPEPELRIQQEAVEQIALARSAAKSASEHLARLQDISRALTQQLLLPRVAP